MKTENKKNWIQGIRFGVCGFILILLSLQTTNCSLSGDWKKIWEEVKAEQKGKGNHVSFIGRYDSEGDYEISTFVIYNATASIYIDDDKDSNYFGNLILSIHGQNILGQLTGGEIVDFEISNNHPFTLNGEENGVWAYMYEGTGIWKTKIGIIHTDLDKKKIYLILGKSNSESLKNDYSSEGYLGFDPVTSDIDNFRKGIFSKNI